MTHTRAAEQCWMSTEKGAASMSLDKRADLVDKCIDAEDEGGLRRGRAGARNRKPAATAEAKKKKPDAAAEAKTKKPAAADEKSEPKGEKDKDKKPAAEAPDKKP